MQASTAHRERSPKHLPGDDLLLKNGKLVLAEGIVEANILVRDGRIVAISRAADDVDMENVIDARGDLVLPGVVDAHVHFREPGLTHKEDFVTGSMSAAAGGVTTVLDMPNTVPPCSSRELLEKKRRMLEGRSFVDFGLYAVLLEENFPDLQNIVSAGAIGFKLFMGPTTGDLPPLNDGLALEALRRVASLKVPVVVHAENRQIVQHLTQELREARRTDVLAHAEARPNVCEEEAVQRVIAFARWTACRTHIAHMSTKEASGLVQAAKAAGVAITAETCPHYLLLDVNDLTRLGPLAKTNPPLRAPSDVDALWNGVRRGVIDTLASDHAPHTPDEKLVDDVWSAAAGFIGVETMLPLMLTQVRHGRLSLARLVDALSARPARIFGIYPRKGSLSVGADADFTIVRLGVEECIRAGGLHSKHKLTPFDSRRVTARVVYTILRGAPIVEEGQIVGKPGGTFIRPDTGG